MTKKLLILPLFFVLILFSNCTEDDPIQNSIGATELSCYFEEDTYLRNNPDLPVDYIVSCEVDIHSTLNIEAGTVIEFDTNSGFVIHENGSISAEGTNANPIVLRSKNGVAGSWNGIYVLSNTNSNSFNHVQILEAGSSPFDGSNVTAAIRVGTVGRPAKAKIQNSTFARSGGDGIYVSKYSGDNAIEGIANNEFTNNAEAAIHLAVSHLHNLDGSNSFSNNGLNKIKVMTGNGNEVLGNKTWLNPGVPIYLDDDIVIGYYTDPGRLTIEAGVVLNFESNRGLEVTSYGSLTINGTAAQPVIFEGTVPTINAWNGIEVFSNNINNQFNYAKLRYGGGESYNSEQRTLITLGGVGSCCSTAYLNLNNTTLEETECAISRYGDNTTFVEENTTYINCALVECD